MESKRWHVGVQSRPRTLDRLHEYHAELHSKIQGIVQAKAQAIEDIRWVKENVEKMEEVLRAFHHGQQQATADKRLLAKRLVVIEKRMAERTVEVETRLKHVAGTVIELRDKVGALEMDLRTAKPETKLDKPSNEACSSKELLVYHYSSKSVRTDVLNQKLEDAEEQLRNDSDLVSKLYDRVCILNNNLAQAKLRPGKTARPVSLEADTRAERMEPAALKKLDDATEEVEAAQAQLQDATKSIVQLRERVRGLTDEARGSPTSELQGNRTLSSPLRPPSRCMSGISGEPPLVAEHKLEEAMQGKCRLLSLEVEYMEKKRAAAVDEVASLDAMIVDKRNQLKSVMQQMKQPSRSKGSFRLFKMFRKV